MIIMEGNINCYPPGSSPQNCHSRQNCSQGASLLYVIHNDEGEISWLCEIDAIPRVPQGLAIWAVPGAYQGCLCSVSCAPANEYCAPANMSPNSLKISYICIWKYWDSRKTNLNTNFLLGQAKWPTFALYKMYVLHLDFCTYVVCTFILFSWF